jgi:hypothetical protein
MDDLLTDIGWRRRVYVCTHVATVSVGGLGERVEVGRASRGYIISI